MRRFVTAVAPLLVAQLAMVSIASVKADTSLSQPRMTFVEAAEPYLKLKYNKDGYIDSKGHVKNDGLGCSSYTSAVLHPMRDGKDWLSQFDWKVYQEYGDVIARRFGLKSAGKFAAADLLFLDATKRLIASGKLASGSLYVFNARKGLQGHVGFVRVKKDGRLIQSHYSGIDAYAGLATGNFRKWLKASQYRKAQIELFLVPE